MREIFNTLMFRAGWFFYKIIFKFIWRVKIIGHKNIPKKGGLIIAPNHMSYADPPLVGSCMMRGLYFMAKEELFRFPPFGFILKSVHAFPVKRGKQDVGAFKHAQRLLEEGKPVLVFPEGTRSRDGNFGKARAGLGMIASHAKVPVIPTRVYNSDKLKKLKKLVVIYGKPIYPPKEMSKEKYQAFSEKVLEEIKKL